MPIQEDDFIRADAPDLGVDYGNDGFWSIVSNAAENSSGNYLQALTYNTTFDAVYNGEIRTRFTFTSGNTPQVHNRVTAGNLRSILGWVSGGTLYASYNNGALFGLTTIASIACNLVINDTYELAIESDGTDHRATVYESDGTTVFAQTVWGTNASQNLAGQPGMSASGGTTRYTLLRSTVLTPTLQITRTPNNTMDDLPDGDYTLYVWNSTFTGLEFTQTVTITGGVIPDITDAALVTGTEYIYVLNSDSYEESKPLRLMAVGV